jgi:uncharacterized Zn-binding protein involved in type VI secretion
MPGPNQARLTDLHICPLTMGVPAPVTAPGHPMTLVCKLPAARMTDMCAGISPHPIAKGSMTVMIGKMLAARIGIDPCASGGPILPPAAITVFTGG